MGIFLSFCKIEYHIHIYFFVLSIISDCGRGFVRIENTCIHISSEAAPKDQIVTKCNDIGAKPLVTDSNALFHQLKSYLQNQMETEDLWSDFKDGWVFKYLVSIYQNKKSILWSVTFIRNLIDF